MAKAIREVMTRNPVILEASDSVGDAARHMRERNVGDVLVARDGELCGIVTDRDLVVRCVAEKRDPSEQKLVLARSQDPKSALGSISAAPATR